MTLSFSFRLLLLCVAVFFVVHQALAWAISALAPVLVRAAGRRSAARAANLLLSARLAPAFGAFVVASLICAPTYLWFEAGKLPERVGIPFLVLAVMGAAVVTASLVKGLRVILDSSRYIRHCERVSRATSISGNQTPLLMIEDPSPLFLVAGVLRPRLVISSGVVEALPPEQLEVAIEHERAHQASRDNLKRLLILLAPGSVFFGDGLRTLEREWGRFIEWAADDRAIAGNPRRSLALADALVRFRRAGLCPQLNPLTIPLTTGGEDLRMRVNRLLDQSGPRVQGRRSRPFPAVALAGLFAILAYTFLAGSNPADSLYQLLEKFHGK
jgi:beta-lactamase regulating signal transducer with metallopeptidase domain